jgi:hypothetical protein
MYFSTKSYLKSTRNHTAKLARRLDMDAYPISCLTLNKSKIWLLPFRQLQDGFSRQLYHIAF